MNTRLRNIAAALLLAGACFRFAAAADVRFTGDEAYFWATAREIVSLQKLPAYGSPITGSEAHVPSPLFHYLNALPQLFGRSPWFGTSFVILLHLLGLVLVADLARRIRGESAALITLSLGIFAPWDIFYGSSIWLSSVVPVHGTLLVYAAFRVRDGPRWQAAFVLLLGVSTALHSSTPVSALAGLVLVALAPPGHWSKRHLLLGLGLAFMAYVPSIVRELVTGFANTRAILNKAGGAEPASYLAFMPAKVFGYAALFSSSEISYHFTRGYWGGGFKELEQYFSAAGLTAWWNRLGLLGIAVALSAIISLAGLGRTILVAAASAITLLRQKSRSVLSEEQKLSVVLVSGLVGATLLLILMKKLFFPHYANPLMQLFLLPPAFLLDGIARRWPKHGRIPAYATTAIIAGSMLISTWTYLKRVDQLNGLSATLAIAEHISKEEEPVALYFDHFHNGYSVNMVLQHYHGKRVEFGAHARVVYRVHNATPHVGPVPEGSWLIGDLRVERKEKHPPSKP